MFKFIYDMFIEFISCVQKSAEILAFVCIVISFIALLAVSIEAVYKIRKK